MTNEFENISKRVFCIAFKKKKRNIQTDFLIQALLRSKIGLLNLDIHKFSYTEWLIHSKRHLKISFSIKFKENPLSYFSLRESLLKPKIGKSNLDFHQCFCNKWLFYQKRHLKRNCMLFEENHSCRFFEAWTSKIGMPNSDFNECFFGKQLIHSEDYEKFLSNLKEIIKAIFETFTSSLISGLP